MRLFTSIFCTLFLALSAFGQAIDYRALRTNQFSTNVPSRGYVGIIGYGVTNIPGTNVQFNSGTGITFTTNGAAITITATGTNQVTITNIVLRAGDNVTITTNGPTDWTVATTEFWTTNASIANSISNKYAGQRGTVVLNGGIVVGNAGFVGTENAVEINGGRLTSASWGVNQLLYSDSNLSATNVFSGTGALTNNGSGVFGWYPLSGLGVWNGYWVDAVNGNDSNSGRSMATALKTIAGLQTKGYFGTNLFFVGPSVYTVPTNTALLLSNNVLTGIGGPIITSRGDEQSTNATYTARATIRVVGGNNVIDGVTIESPVTNFLAWPIIHYGDYSTTNFVIRNCRINGFTDVISFQSLANWTNATSVEILNNYLHSYWDVKIGSFPGGSVVNFRNNTVIADASTIPPNSSGAVAGNTLPTWWQAGSEIGLSQSFVGNSFRLLSTNNVAAQNYSLLSIGSTTATNLVAGNSFQIEESHSNLVAIIGINGGYNSIGGNSYVFQTNLGVIVVLQTDTSGTVSTIVQGHPFDDNLVAYASSKGNTAPRLHYSGDIGTNTPWQGAFLYYDTANTRSLTLNGGSLTNLAGTNIDIVYSTGLSASTNGHQVTVTATGTNAQAVVVAGTNVTVQTNGSAYTVNSTGGAASIGPGTVNQVAKFTSTTNVGDSIVSETATNQWEWRSRLSPNAWTNNITNAIYGRDSGAGSWDRLELVAASGLGNGYNELNGRTTLSAPNGNAPLKIFDTMIINHGVTSASGNPAGAVGPVQDNFSTFGTSSGRWKSIWVGPDGYRMTDAVDISTPNLTATTYSINLFSGGIEMFKNSFGFIGGFWRDPNLLGGMVLPAAGVIGAGSGNFVWDTFMKRGNEAHTWMFQTNNNSASAPPAAVLEGSEGTGTDGAGGVMRIASGRGTGDGIAPNLYFATPITNGGSGSGIQSLIDRMQINGTNGNVIIYSNLTVNGSFSAGSISDPNALTNNDTRNITFTGSFTDTRNGVSTVIDSNTITSGTLTLSGSGTNYFGANLNVSGTVNATGYTNSGLTASRLMLTDANKAQASAAASGAVPVDADGSAATFAQVSSLAPGYVVTNGNANVFNQSNTLSVVTGTRTFTHDSTQTIITNTATLTGTEFAAGQRKEYFNGANTYLLDKTNGAVTMQGAISFFTNLQATANFNRGWAMTNPAASYTQAAPIGVDAGATLFQQTLYTITNNSGSAITVTLPGGLKKATWWGTNVTAFYVTNSTMQWWTCRPGETNVYIEGGY